MGRRKKGDKVTGWVNLDKPLNLTSTQAMAKVRRIMNAQKAGHAGTLDPLATGILPIARSKRREVLEIYRKSVERVRQGETFALAPEGTRQEDGKTLGAFKRGPFLFSLAGEIPIQPIVITGADDILPKGDLLPALGRWSWNIHLTVLPEISTKGVDEEGMAKVQAEVFDQMKTQLEKDLKQRDHTPSVE